jgi:hypothetical protein
MQELDYTFLIIASFIGQFFLSDNDLCIELKYYYERE